MCHIRLNESGVKMEVVKKENNQLAMQNTELDAIFGDFKIDSSDILIPKILLMQPVSPFVNDGLAMLGDFRNSVTKEKLGSITEPFSFVPFHYAKCWDIVAEGGEYVRREEFRPGDESLPWEFDEDGKRLKRIKRLDFFGFHMQKLSEGHEMPMILPFRSTGYREGTKILTQFQMNISKRKLPWSDVWVIRGEKKKNDDNQTYCVPIVDIAVQADEATLKLCMDWYKNIKSMTIRVVVDESDTKASTDNLKDVSSTGNF